MWCCSCTFRFFFLPSDPSINPSLSLTDVPFERVEKKNLKGGEKKSISQDKMKWRFWKEEEDKRRVDSFIRHFFLSVGRSVGLPHPPFCLHCSPSLFKCVTTCVCPPVSLILSPFSFPTIPQSQHNVIQSVHPPTHWKHTTSRSGRKRESKGTSMRECILSCSFLTTCWRVYVCVVFGVCLFLSTCVV